MALRTGYGTGVYGSSKYSLPEVYEAAVSDASSATVAAVGQRIAIAAASEAITSSNLVSAQRIQNGSVTSALLSSASATGYTALAGAVSDTTTTSVSLYWNRVRPFSASDSAAIDASVISRYKWLDTSVSAVTWADANYREGAA